MKAAIWLRRYAAHPDPLTSAANFVALVVAGNGPFYPVYVMALIGWDRAGAWLSMLASPLFFAVPAISRLSPRAGRAALLCADDRWLALSLAGSAIACLTLLTEYSLPGLMALPPAAAATLTRLNLISVATLTAFVALTLAKAWQLHPSDTRRRQPRC
jgi:hypothetical protein